MRELIYRVHTGAGGLVPGHHRSRGGTSGFEFRAHVPLADAPDARRLDLHASLRDPFGGWIVRLHSERRAVPVAVVADLSASMGFVGAQRKLDVLADFCDCLAWSAWRTGDPYGFVGCDESVRPEFVLPVTRRRGIGPGLARQLRAFEPSGRSARGLRDAARHLPARRSLVFLVSDFHLPLDELRAVLAALAGHELVPIVIWQAAEFELPARHGLAQVEEPESARRGWLWWRPALRQRWIAAREERRSALRQLFRAARLAPLFIESAFDPDAVTKHFAA